MSEEINTENKAENDEKSETVTSQEEYEFSHEEDLLLTDFNYRSIILGGLVMLLGLISLLDYFINDKPLVNLFTSIFLIVISLSFYLPTYNFKKIVETAGSDITELMEGINKFVIGWAVMVGILAIYRIIQFVQLFD